MLFHRCFVLNVFGTVVLSYVTRKFPVLAILHCYSKWFNVHYKLYRPIVCIINN